MIIRIFLAVALAVMAACTPEDPPSEPAPVETTAVSNETVEEEAIEDEEVAGEGVTPRPRIFWISSSDARAIPHRVLDAVNAVRAEKGLPEIVLSNQLIAAARTHSRDMSVQFRLWHFGSDGSSPLDRAATTGYDGQVLGENIAESFESDLDTIAAWMQRPENRKLILHSDARRMGIGWYQDKEGRIWWTMVVGT